MKVANLVDTGLASYCYENYFLHKYEYKMYKPRLFCIAQMWDTSFIRRQQEEYVKQNVKTLVDVFNVGLRITSLTY